MIANQKAHNMENSLKNLVFWESLDMVKGTLSFALDGEFFGIAFSSEALKQDPVYPAISLINVAEYSLKNGIPAPPYFLR